MDLSGYSYRPRMFSTPTERVEFSTIITTPNTTRVLVVAMLVVLAVVVVVAIGLFSLRWEEMGV